MSAVSTEYLHFKIQMGSLVMSAGHCGYVEHIVTENRCGRYTEKSPRLLPAL